MSAAFSNSIALSPGDFKAYENRSSEFFWFLYNIIKSSYFYYTFYNCFFDAGFSFYFYGALSIAGTELYSTTWLYAIGFNRASFTFSTALSVAGISTIPKG